MDGVHCIKVERTVEHLARAMASVATRQVDLAKIGRAGTRLVSSDLSFDRYLNRHEAVFHEHARPWRHQTADDPHLPLLAFLKHNLSMTLRFG